EQLLLLADQVVVERQRAGDVRQPVDGVVHVRLGPHADRVRAGGDAQVQPPALQFRVLPGDGRDQVTTLRIGPKGPALRGQPVPGVDLRRRAHQVTVDAASGDRRRVGGYLRLTR